MTELLFIYGTLKRGFPNHHFFEDQSLGSIRFVGKAKTIQKYPLIIDEKNGNLPFLIDSPRTGQVL